MGGNKCNAVFYTYTQIGMRSLELFWPCLIFAKNLGDVLAHGLFIVVRFKAETHDATNRCDTLLQQVAATIHLG